MTARRLDNRHSLRSNVIAEIGSRSNAILQVILVQDLLQANRNRFEIAPGEAAVRGIALGQNEQVFFPLRKRVVIGAQEPTDICQTVFLRGHGAAIAVAEHLLRDLLRGL